MLWVNRMQVTVLKNVGTGVAAGGASSNQVAEILVCQCARGKDSRKGAELPILQRARGAVRVQGGSSALWPLNI